MIPENFIIQWQTTAPWQTLAMVEQDLIISKALIDLYNHNHIQTSLVFRGGTALNKLHVQSAARYSEDIDCVQIVASPIGETINSVRECLDHWLGEPKRKLTERSVKLIYRYQAIDNTPAKLKIEINTTEHFHQQPLEKMRYSIRSEWFSGNAEITTYNIDELIATKLRALFQRRKGRDLFDLWLVLKHNLINPEKVISIFKAYMNYNNQVVSRFTFENNLEEKEKNTHFLTDMAPLLAPENSWSTEEAFNFVRKKLIVHLSD